MNTQPAPKRRTKTVVVIVVVLAMVSAAEVGSRFVRLTPDPWTSLQALWRGVGIPDLARVLEPDPVLLWRVRPGLKDFEVKGYLATEFVSFHVTTDEHGFRTTANASNDATPVVLFLGDSTTFGVGIEAEETYAGRLDALLAEVRVLNGAIPRGSAYQARILVEQTKVKPDCVVACLGTDVGDASWLENLGDLEFAQMEVSRQRWAKTCGLYFLLFHDLPTNWHRRRLPTRRPRLNASEFDDEATRLSRWCKERQVPLILMSSMVKGQEVHRPYQLYVGELAETEQAPLLDMLEVLRDKDPDAVFFEDRIHLKPAGHALVAEALEPLVREALDLE